MKKPARNSAPLFGAVLLLVLLFPVLCFAAAPEEKPPTKIAPETSDETKAAEGEAAEAEPVTPPDPKIVPVISGVSLTALQSVPGARSPVSRDPDAGEWFMELRYRVNDTVLAGNIDRSFLHGGTNHHSEVTLLRKVSILGFGDLEAMGLFRYTDDPRVDPEVNSLQRGYVRFTGPAFEMNFGDYLTNYSRFSFNQNTKGLNIWKQAGSFKFTGTAGVFVDRWGSLFKKYDKFTDPTQIPDPRFPSKPFTRLVLGIRAEQRIDENSFVGVNFVRGSDVKKSLPREAEVRPVVNNVLSLDTSVKMGRDFQLAGEVALSFTRFDSRLQPNGTGSNAARLEMSHRAGRVSWRLDYALFRPNFFSVNARQVQDLQDFSARGSVDLGANAVLNLSFRHTNNNLPGLPVVVTPEGSIDPVVLFNRDRTRGEGASGLVQFRRIVDENLNPLTTTVQTPEARMTIRRLPPAGTMQVNFGYRERQFRTNNKGSFSPTTGDPLFRERVTRIPFLDLEWSMLSTQLGLSYEYRQNRDRVTTSNSTFTNRFVGNYRGTYFLGNWVVTPMFRFETEPEGKNLECGDTDRQKIDGNNSPCFLTTALDFPGRDQTRSYQGALEVDFPKFLTLELLYRELNARLLTSFTKNMTDLDGADVPVRFLGNGGYRRPYGRVALTLKIKNSEDHILVVSFERGVNTFSNPDTDPTLQDKRSFQENVMQLEYVIRWRR